MLENYKNKRVKCIKCIKCLGCNMLEMKSFKGKFECENFVDDFKTKDENIDYKQIKFGG